ncbi:MAG: mono/diheme cytochrome c family protein [Myxococcota bacterium]
MKPEALVSLVAILLALTTLMGCEEVPTQTVNKCYPTEGACAEFLGANARVEASLELGEKVFLRTCAGCHGRDGKGAGNVDRGDFGDPGWHRRWSDEELMGIVTAGRGMKMPGSRLPPLELKSVVAYVRSFDADRGKADNVIKRKEGQGPVGPF